MQQDLKDTVALVTGAAGNLGIAMCRALRAEGVRVVAGEIGDAPADKLGADWRKLDVTSEDSWRQLIDGIRSDYGQLDVLVNNAGVAPMEKLESFSLEEWRRCQAINVDGVFLGMKSATPLMRESGAKRRGGSAMINIASGAADRPAAFSTAYCTSKAAVRMLTRAAAVEFGALRYPIRVNSVHPGAVRSHMMDEIKQRYSSITGVNSVDDLHGAIAAGHPMGRFVEPDEVADAVVYLASSAARYVHGDALHVDGGYAAS